MKPRINEMSIIIIRAISYFFHAQFIENKVDPINIAILISICEQQFIGNHICNIKK